jgi:hypothetical protein
MRKWERQHDSKVAKKKMLLKRQWQKGRKAAKVAKGIDDKGQSESDPLFWEVFEKWCRSL